MKLRELKRLACKVASTFCVLLLVFLFCGAAEGTLHWAAALALGFGDVLVLNAICGLLLPAPASDSRASSAPHPAPALRIVRGGRAA